MQLEKLPLRDRLIRLVSTPGRPSSHRTSEAPSARARMELRAGGSVGIRAEEEHLLVQELVR